MLNPSPMATEDVLVVFQHSGADVLTLPLHSIYRSLEGIEGEQSTCQAGGAVQKSQSLLEELLCKKETAVSKPAERDSKIFIDLSTECGCSRDELDHLPSIGAYLCSINSKQLTHQGSKNIRKMFFSSYETSTKEWSSLISLCKKLRLVELLTQLQRSEFQETYLNLVGELRELKLKANSSEHEAEQTSNDRERRRNSLERKAIELEKAIRELDQDPGLEVLDQNNSPSDLIFEAARAKDKLEVELQSIRYMCDHTYVEEKNQGKSLAYNLIVAGVTGTGKSSSLNTILDRQVCAVSGAQAQGTRGCNMQDGSISDRHFVSFIDTQGLGADTSITDTELLRQIMRSTESVHRMGIINNILISMDLASRQTPAAMANQLTLMELFSEVRTSCFLILTKWNTNSVQAEWNKPLRTWVRKWRKAKRLADIKEDPPCYHEMYQAYCSYIVTSMNNEQDGGSFSKMGTFLAFFESRVLWMYNLDGIQIEDREDGELAPHIQRLYDFYREKALDTLYIGRKHIDVDTITFLKQDELSLGTMATELIEMRNAKINSLEGIGRESRKLSQMESVFKDMVSQNSTKMQKSDFDRGEKSYIDEIANIAGMGKAKKAEGKGLGCVVC